MKQLSVFLLLFWASLSFAQNENVPSAANEICPILIGESIPKGTLKDTEGKSVDIQKLIKKKNTVLVFYRGSWCPYCNSQLSGLQKIEDQINELGFQVVAISPDLPKNLNKSIDKEELKYQLFSDSKMEYSQKLGLAFKVDDKTRKRYKAFGIDLEKSSGETHYQLPAPAVFVLNKKGEVQFSYINPNYKVRLAPEILLAVLKASK